MTDAELREIAEMGSRRGTGVSGKRAQDLAEGCLALLDRFVGMKHQHHIVQDRYLKDIDERGPHLYAELARLRARLAEVEANAAEPLIEWKGPDEDGDLTVTVRGAEGWWAAGYGKTYKAAMSDLGRGLTGVERGEVVNACPECTRLEFSGLGKSYMFTLLLNSDPPLFQCADCWSVFSEPAYWQRVDERQSHVAKEG